MGGDTPGKVIRESFMKAVRPVIASNEVPYLQIRLVGMHSTSGKDKEEMKERTRKK